MPLQPSPPRPPSVQWSNENGGTRVPKVATSINADMSRRITGSNRRAAQSEDSESAAGEPPRRPASEDSEAPEPEEPQVQAQSEAPEKSFLPCQ
eukprot:3939616-Rhodomonas_salina.1